MGKLGHGEMNITTTPTPAVLHSCIAEACQGLPEAMPSDLDPPSEGFLCALDTTPFVLLLLTIALLCIQIVASASQLYERYKDKISCAVSCREDCGRRCCGGCGEVGRRNGDYVPNSYIFEEEDDRPRTRSTTAAHNAAARGGRTSPKSDASSVHSVSVTAR